MSKASRSPSQWRTVTLAVGAGVPAALVVLSVLALYHGHAGIHRASAAIHAQVTSGGEWSIDTVTEQCGLTAHEGTWACPDDWVFWRLPVVARPRDWPSTKHSSPERLEAQYLLTRHFLGHDLEYLFLGIDPETDTVFAATASDFYAGWVGLEGMLCLATVVGSVAALAWLSASRRWGG